MTRLAITIMTAFLMGSMIQSTLAEKKGKAKEPARFASIPAREHGYSNVKTQVIKDEASYNTFIETVKKQGAWNNREAFLKGLNEANIDYKTEALVLVRNTQGSGSVPVRSDALSLKDTTLHVKIKVGNTGGFGTADMAYYCFAVVVNKAKIHALSVEVTNREPVKIPVK